MQNICPGARFQTNDKNLEFIDSLHRNIQFHEIAGFVKNAGFRRCWKNQCETYGQGDYF